MKNKRTGIPLYILFVALLTLAGYLGFGIGDRQTEEEIAEITTEVEESLGYSESKVVDVIGTASSPFRFSAEAAASRYSTTTGTIFVGADVNILDLNVNVIEASTTEDVILMVESSNDADCATSTSDGISGIKWVDSAPTDTTLKTVTTTHPFTLAAGHGGKFQITNWNALCARVSAGSASSTVWISASKQQLNEH